MTLPEINPYVSRVQEFQGRIFSAPQISSSEYAALLQSPKILLELGSGSGGHLIELARKNPDSVCIGIERRFKRAVRTIEKAEVAGLFKVFICRGEFQDFCPTFLKNTVDAVHVNFPDPWEKKRWRKHRSLSSDLLDWLSTTLKKGGELSVKSDHREYFEEFASIARKDSRYELTQCTTNLYAQLRESNTPQENIQTEFEQLFVAQGLDICALKARYHGISSDA